ncbi:MAG: RpiB/LacA/LacB family sugar-phosphate isomerase, partial [Muribaculaceae bacterium]|nr:RpiB/LacA/LacB family sugar-phosphate isomerase [Muribaculaceae bacterium]
MKVAFACDHAGYELKEFLIGLMRERGYEIADFGTHSTESCDYPDYAHPAAAAVES